MRFDSLGVLKENGLHLADFITGSADLAAGNLSVQSFSRLLEEAPFIVQEKYTPVVLIRSVLGHHVNLTATGKRIERTKGVCLTYNINLVKILQRNFPNEQIIL